MGHAFPGLGLNHCVPIQQDGVQIPIRFDDAKSLKAARGRTIPLRMKLVNASVFGLTFG